MIPFQTLLAENAPFLGTFVQSAAPEFLEASAYAGFRFAAIDLEHTYYGVEKMAELIRAGEAAGLSMLPVFRRWMQCGSRSRWISAQPV